MKAIIYKMFLLSALLVQTALAFGSETVNKLFVTNIEGAAGKEVVIPIDMTNTDEIVAVQFNIHLPFSRSASNVTVPGRADGHTVSVRSLGNNNYTVVIVSMENRSLKGNSGLLLNFPVKTDATAQAGDTFVITLSDVVLSDKEGNNVATGHEPGVFTVQKVPTPDLTVTDVAIVESGVMPEGILNVNWKVSNIGDESTGAGWTEKIYLVNASTEERVYIGNMRSSAILAAGSRLSRSASLIIPKSIGTEGDLYADVDVVTETATGELIADRGNNTERSAQTTRLGKTLYLTGTTAPINESSTSPVRFQLMRSGDWSLEETFEIETDGTGLLSVPSSVTVPAGQAAVYFYVTPVNNETVNDISNETLRVKPAHGYSGVSQSVAIEDDEFLTLLLSLSKSRITEEETLQLTVTAQRVSAGADTVYLSCELPRRFKFPASVTIPAGETTATVDIVAVEDDIADVTQSVAFWATANHYNKGEAILLLDDNDLPDIDLEIQPNSVSEGAGLVAMMAKLSRTAATNSKITVKISDDSGGELYYSTKSVVLEKGATAAEFTIGVVDNVDVEGERTHKITAAVYLSSCSCSAEGTSHGVVTKDITILDDDGPSLKLTVASSMVQEGDANGTNLIVRRNTSTENALQVTISSDDACMEYGHTVTIPAGAQSVSVPVKAKLNSISGDTRTIAFNAVSEGFTKGTCWLLVSDETLPDATVSAINVSNDRPEVCTPNNISFTVTNSGIIDLAANTKIYIYAGNSNVALDTLATNRAVVSGGSLEISGTVTMPDKTGATTIYAVVNPEKIVPECLYINNTSEKVAVTLLPPYTATAMTDKRVYGSEASVVITGTATGSKTANVPVEIYVMNEGARYTVVTTTDDEGNYTAVWSAAAQQMGHFTVGACYPGEGLSAEQASFDIYGLRRVNSGYIKCETLVGTVYEGAIVLSNPGNLDLTDVGVEILSSPENCTVQFQSIASLKGGEQASLKYTLSGAAPSRSSNWENINIRIGSAEGASFPLTLYYYCRAPLGKLRSDISKINTTMIKGTSRDFSFTVTNIGKGATGNITLALPENQKWMQSITPKEISSIAPDESTTVILRLTPTEDMELNVPVTGSIGLNCENGEGLPLSFRIEPVSGATGILTIDVCDEFTYYTESAPHLRGAQVVIKHPTTGALVTQGLTDENGLYSIELPEGYYSVNVTADKHDSYQGNILVDPERETRQVVNLSFQAITVDWKVVETEVEDVYEIVTTLKYETNVPVPVIEVILPDSIPLEELETVGSYLINAVVTNKGLITAKQVSVNIKEVRGIEVEYLMENGFDLAPSTSTVVPIRIKKVNDPSAIRSFERKKGQGIIACTLDAVIDWMWACGGDMKSNTEELGMKLAECAGVSGSVSVGGGGGGGGGLGYPGRGGGGGGYSGSSTTHAVETAKSDCDPCLNNIGKVLTKCLVKRIPIVEKILEIEEMLVCTKEVVVDGDLTCVAEEIITSNKWVEKIVGYKEIYEDCIKNLFDECSFGDKSKIAGRRGTQRIVLPDMNVYPSYIESYLTKLNNVDYLIQTRYAELLEVYGDSCWLSATTEELAIFSNGFEKWIADEITDAEFRSYRPASITEIEMNAFIERLNNTFENNTASDNRIHAEVINNCHRAVQEIEKEVIDEGFTSLSDYYETAEAELKEGMEESKSSVCTSVTIELSQTMTMTRQAFLGTLTVFNGHESKAMTDVKLRLEVTDEEGDLTTSHEFQINPTQLIGFEGGLNLTDGWRLAGQTTGVATIQFIPTKYAAPTEPKQYSFGGMLSYVNPYSGETVTRELYPVELTVKPSPDLDLTYFMQRDILGDNALTTDVIEPMEEAEFSLLIHNTGNGDATNVRIVTDQPKIVENEKGLLIDFELISSQVNGQSRTLALGGSVPADFGTISAHSTAYAQWWLQCSLLGHFVDYDVKATHVTSYGNEDLSLLNKVTIHELIRSLEFATPDGNSLTGFLANDIADSYDFPDVLYFSDASIVNVLKLDNELIILTKKSEVQYEMKMLPTVSGWYYGKIVDPVGGKAKLIDIVRKEDGKSISLRNFWQTEYTLRDGREPLQEYLLHFADSIGVSGNTYILTFEPHPDTVLAVEAFEGVDKTIKVQSAPVQNISVRFNKPVRPETFDIEDLKLICQGKDVALSDVTMNTDDNKTYQLNLSPATTEDGYYVLTVQTAKVTDNEGFNGQSGNSIDWIQFLDGRVVVTAAASPAEGGSVPAEQTVAYDSVITLSATPARDYVFDGWYQDEKLVCDSLNYTSSYLEHAHLSAHFKLKQYDVTLNYTAERGTVTGGGTGVYAHGTTITLKAVPADGYRFGGWAVDGVIQPDHPESTYTLAVTRNVEIMAMFTVQATSGTFAGDVNNDKRLNVTDVSSLLNYLSGNIPDGFNEANADVNRDGRINVTDVTTLINIIVEQE